MDTNAALIAAIAADPDSDPPRLVYADWLEDNGQQERAEFIRLQCGRADEAACTRAAALFAAHGTEWGVPLAPLAAKTWYCRGFPEVIEVDITRLVENQSLLSVAPKWHLLLVREGRDYRTPPQTELCARLAIGPFANRISGLNLAQAGWDLTEIAALLAPPLTGRLRELRFGDDDDSPEALALLVANPELRLAELGFGGDSYGGIGDDGCQILAGTPAFGTLKVLELPNNDLGPDAATALALSPHLTELESLYLAGGSNTPNRIGPSGARAIADSANFRHLATLDLMFNWIGDDGFAALARSPNLPALTSLNAPGNGITDAGIHALATSTALPNLGWLNLCASSRQPAGISAAGVRALVESPRLKRLTGLKLAGNRIGDEGAFALAGSPNCSSLTQLHVGECGITVAGFIRLLESPHLAGVEEFALDRNPLSPDERQALKAKDPRRVR